MNTFARSGLQQLHATDNWHKGCQWDGTEYMLLKLSRLSCTLFMRLETCRLPLKPTFEDGGIIRWVLPLKCMAGALQQTTECNTTFNIPCHESTFLCFKSPQFQNTLGLPLRVYTILYLTWEILVKIKTVKQCANSPLVSSSIFFKFIRLLSRRMSQYTGYAVKAELSCQ